MCPGFGLGTREAVTTVDSRNSLPTWLLEHSRDKGAPGTEVSLWSQQLPQVPCHCSGEFFAPTPRERRRLVGEEGLKAPQTPHGPLCRRDDWRYPPMT